MDGWKDAYGMNWEINACSVLVFTWSEERWDTKTWRDYQGIDYNIDYYMWCVLQSEEKKLESAEKYLEQSAIMFDEFLKENDKNSVEAIKM